MCISALGLKDISNPYSSDVVITGTDGKKKFFDPKFVLSMIDSACQDLSDPWKIEQLYSRIEAKIYGGITENEICRITLDAAAFYALYDREFEVVSKKLNRKIKPLMKSYKKVKVKNKKAGFSSLLS